MDCIRQQNNTYKRAFTLIELLIVVAILGFLSIIAAEQFTDAPSAQALALYTVANRMVSDWEAVADACAVDSQASNRIAAASGHDAADILAGGNQMVAPSYRNCFSYLHLAPLSDVVLTQNGTAVSVLGHPVQFTGGGSAPYVVTYQNVPEKVVVALMTTYSVHTHAGNTLLAADTAANDRINYQRQATDSYQVEIIFPVSTLLMAAGPVPTGVTVVGSNPPGTMPPPGTVSPPGTMPPPGTVQGPPGGGGNPNPTPGHPHAPGPPPITAGGPPPGSGQNPPPAHGGNPGRHPRPPGGGNPCANLANDPQSRANLLSESGADSPVTLPNGCTVSVVRGNGNRVTNNGAPILVVGNDNVITGNGGTVFAIGTDNTSTGYQNMVNLAGIDNAAIGTKPGTASGNGAPFVVTGNGNTVSTQNGGPVIATGNGNNANGNSSQTVITGNGNNSRGNGGPSWNTGNGNNSRGNGGPSWNTGNGNNSRGNSGPVSNTGNGNGVYGTNGPVLNIGNGQSPGG